MGAQHHFLKVKILHSAILFVIVVSKTQASFQISFNNTGNMISYLLKKKNLFFQG